MRSYCLVLGCILGVLLTCGQAQGVLGPSFSLDDNPAGPITSPVGWIPGFGAEDPYGLGLFGGPRAPSPTLPAVLPGGAMDADILRPDPAGGPVPVIDVAASLTHQQPFGYIDAVSDSSSIARAISLVLHMAFSVDRTSIGQAGTAVSWQSGLSQQPGDIFRTDLAYRHPLVFVGTPGTGGYSGPLGASVTSTNFMVLDESWMNLTAGNGVGSSVGPNVGCPQIRPGSHDNVDAANWQELDLGQDLITDTDMFFSVAPDERGLSSGMLAADIYRVPAGAPTGAFVLYVQAVQMGLQSYVGEEDNIDALVVWDSILGNPGSAEPAIDYALFSLSAGSISLSMNGLSPADIFFTDFTGSFWLYASGNDLGLMTGPQGESDNVDALEVMVPGDANLDGIVDLDDFVILKNNFGSGTRWTQGDFDGDGDVDLDDFVILKNAFGTVEGL